MKLLRRLTAIGGLTALFVVPALGGGAASAASKVPVHGGSTTVITAPGIAKTLVENDIFASTGKPGSTAFVAGRGLSLRFTFPVTGGRASLDPLGGKVTHRGSIVFVNFKDNKKIRVGDFTIDLSKKRLTGIVNGDPRKRVPLFNLDLSAAKIFAKGHSVRATKVGLKLTGTAAKALNSALGTSIFQQDLLLGSANSHLRL
ncbi:hypothetical protein Sru01_68870 [Sphaerisporangium rufum]|uniref:Htaa domain-containing protein n=1 Tax=Sphaerisporangium rufum TaxID=1381558 RepID=A0A919RDC3_9ACTN|nr:hypothetical protein [Sphaerisporangium rufum]GII81905.1 hypothetical protein Sru01_68870 [Sphaerisporangium rufum]